MKASIEYLRTVLRFDPVSGQFAWLKSIGRKRSGDLAGCLYSTGYRVIRHRTEKRAKPVEYLEHVLAWAFTYDDWPSSDIDHKDGDRLNNRPQNLRLVTMSQNLANSKLSAANTSGYRGVYKVGKRWQVKIMHNYRSICFGRFDTPEEAHAVRNRKALELFGEFARVE